MPTGPHGAAAGIPPPTPATLALRPVACKLLFIARSAEGRKLSWPEQAHRRLETCAVTRMRVVVKPRNLSNTIMNL